MMRSDNDQERATAARLATSLIAEAGMTWTDVVTRVGLTSNASTPAPPSSRSRSRATSRTQVRNGVKAARAVKVLARARNRLTAWEGYYVDSLLCIGPELSLTEAQWRMIDVILNRLDITVKQSKSG